MKMELSLMVTIRIYFIAVMMVLLLPITVIADEKVILNGKIWTGNADQPWVEAIAINNDRIVGVGSSTAISAKYSTANVIDVKGKLVLPGFIDNHVHFMDGALSLVSVNSYDTKSASEFSQVIKDYASKMPKGEWMLGGVWDHENWGGDLPHKNWVDDYTNDNPIYLLRTDGHIAFVNSKALEFAGITKETPDPDGGVIVRDKDGEPTGVLIDNAMLLVSSLYPQPNDSKIDDVFDVGIKETLENGVTQIHSMDMAVWNNLPIFKRAKADGRLKVRTNYYSHITKRHELAAMIKEDGHGDNLLRFGGIKVMVDGALGSGTAWLHEPYSDEPNNSGFPIRPMDELKIMLQESHDYGFQLAIHGIGDKANDEIFKIIDQIGANGNRPRIEHAQHLSPDAFKRFKELGVVAAAHPYHVVDDGRFAEKRLGKTRLAGTYAFKSLIDAGAMVSFGSDWFVAPIKPLLGIYAATTRRTADGKNPDGWIPNEKISVEQAVKAYTINNAYAGNQENDLGTIEVGKLADIVVISDDIFEISPKEIINSKVVMTMIGGQVLFQSE